MNFEAKIPKMFEIEEMELEIFLRKFVEEIEKYKLNEDYYSENVTAVMVSLYEAYFEEIK